MNKNWKRQQKRITEISKNLRMQYYIEHNSENCIFKVPHGIAGNLTESIGSWPEFIFRGTFCKRTFNGFCSPCFYSQFPVSEKSNCDIYENMIRSQFDFVIDNFEDIVIKRQYGKTEDGIVKFVLTPTGSYFDETEFPQRLRIEMLNKINQVANKYSVKVFLHVECHCKDWNALDKQTDESKEEILLLRKLNAKLLFGFESINDYVRNVLYNKNLNMDEFIFAYDSALAANLKVGVFIFAGLFSMNDALTIKDTCSSIDFAVNKGITPVLMFQNIQQHTITDLLYRSNNISLLEPFTVMEIVLHLTKCVESISGSDWLIADPKGGPPVPEYNIFDCARITSKENSDKIYKMICELRLSRDTETFVEHALELMSTDNYKDYCNFINKCGKYNMLEQYTDSLITCAENIYKQQYGRK